MELKNLSRDNDLAVIQQGRVVIIRYRFHRSFINLVESLWSGGYGRSIGGEGCLFLVYQPDRIVSQIVCTSSKFIFVWIGSTK